MKIEEKLVNYPLFKNITGQEVRQLMACINFTEKSYKKSEYLLMEGEKVNRIGIIVNGRLAAEGTLGELVTQTRLEEGSLEDVFFSLAK